MLRVSLILARRPAGTAARAPLILGRGRNPLPSVGLLLAVSRSRIRFRISLSAFPRFSLASPAYGVRTRTTPLLVFIAEWGSVASAKEFFPSFGSALARSPNALAGMPSGTLAFYVCDRVPSLSALRELASHFKLGKVSCRCRIRYV